MRDRVLQLCKGFVECLMDDDFAGAAEWAAPPVSIATSSGQRVLADHDAVADDLRVLWKPYSGCSTVLMRPNVIDIRSYAPNLCIADVEWRMADGNGSHLRTLFSTYTFRDTKDGLKVVQIISHNEQLQRPA